MTPFDLITLARQASSAEELLSAARANKIVLSEEDAQIYFERWHGEYELSDDELEAVGGGMEENGRLVCEYCKSDRFLAIDLSGGGYYCDHCKRRCHGEIAR